jgi:hypothetical protein
MTIDESSDSLVGALTKARIPAGNHEFIRLFLRAAGIVDFHAVASPAQPYVLARRDDGLPDLHIYYGYTNGFTSQEEIRSVAGQGAVGRPSSRKGTWYVEHPINKVRPASGRSSDVRRKAEFCDCGMQLSLTGVCDSCD